jgi:hypothetical protein
MSAAEGFGSAVQQKQQLDGMSVIDLLLRASRNRL